MIIGNNKDRCRNQIPGHYMKDYKKSIFNFLNDFKSRNLSLLLIKSRKLPNPGNLQINWGKLYILEQV